MFPVFCPSFTKDSLSSHILSLYYPLILCLGEFLRSDWLILRQRANSPTKGFFSTIQMLVHALNLPSLTDILSGGWSRLAWKRYVKRLLFSTEYSLLLDSCDNLPLSDCLVRLGKPIPHWMVTHGLPRITCWNNFHIRLLVGCHGLEVDACCFCRRMLSNYIVNDLMCMLCGLEPEDPAHLLFTAMP